MCKILQNCLKEGEYITNWTIHFLLSMAALQQLWTTTLGINIQRKFYFQRHLLRVCTICCHLFSGTLDI